MNKCEMEKVDYGNINALHLVTKIVKLIFTT